jgi:NarL family two-component system sensor histidine kinase LiaS
MQKQSPLPSLKFEQRLVLSYATIALLSGLVAWLLRREWAQGSLWSSPVVRFGAVLATGLALGAWVSLPLARRLRHMLEIGRAWLRGNLAARLEDESGDEIGELARTLNQVAENLERDERDLEELLTRNARLSDQVRALAVVEERNRLARELHDSVKQHLFSLAMTSSAIRARLQEMADLPQDLEEMTQEVERAAQTAQRETTRLIEDLRPGSLQSRGLEATLNDYTLLFGAQEHLLVYLDVQGDAAKIPLSVAEAILRVAQEALHNTARHAQATRANVVLICAPGRVTLRVVDNGIGFEPAQVRHGMGLANMHERMLALGGRLNVQSSPGGGTHVEADVVYDRLPARPTAWKPRVPEPPAIENWAWLGQKLVIPVGQQWPWLPADMVHLQNPLVDPDDGPYLLCERPGLLGLGRSLVLKAGQTDEAMLKIQAAWGRYDWQLDHSHWELKKAPHSESQMVLSRNGQPLAAMQYMGRQMHTWTEIIYDGRTYRLSYMKDSPEACTLIDQTGEQALATEYDGGALLKLVRPLPLQLVLMAGLRVVEEWNLSAGA